MSKSKTAMNLLLHDRNAFLSAILNLVPGLFPDKMYIGLQYKLKMGRRINWDEPRFFTEKLQWLKLNNKNPLYTIMVDKYEVKDYIADIIGKQYIIPTLGVWDKAEDIDWNCLPNQFVLKTTHGGGGSGVILVENKRKINQSEVCKKIQKALGQKIYKYNREWPYKNVKPRIIAEEFLSPKISSVQNRVDDGRDHADLKDYKFFCFNGKVRCFKVDFDRFVDHHANYYSPEGELLPFGEKKYPPIYEHKEPMPSNLHEMVTLAETISKGHPFMRVDLYNINGIIYFGETTFFPAGGFGRFTSDDWDLSLGELLEISNRPS